MATEQDNEAAEAARMAANKAWLTPMPDAPPEPAPAADADGKPIEVGGPPGPDPSRYGDWELKGICVDFS